MSIERHDVGIFFIASLFFTGAVGCFDRGIRLLGDQFGVIRVFVIFSEFLGDRVGKF